MVKQTDSLRVVEGPDRAHHPWQPSLRNQATAGWLIHSRSPVSPCFRPLHKIRKYPVKLDPHSSPGYPFHLVQAEWIVKA